MQHHCVGLSQLTSCRVQERRSKTQDHALIVNHSGNGGCTGQHVLQPDAIVCLVAGDELAGLAACSWACTCVHCAMHLWRTCLTQQSASSVGHLSPAAYLPGASAPWLQAVACATRTLLTGSLSPASLGRDKRARAHKLHLPNLSAMALSPHKKPGGQHHAQLEACGQIHTVAEHANTRSVLAIQSEAAAPAPPPQ